MYKMYKKIIVAVALTLGSFAGVSAATLAADADSSIRGGFASDAVLGSGTFLLAANLQPANGVIDPIKSYIRFDLSGESNLFQNAELALTSTFTQVGSPSPLSFSVYGLGDALGDSWIETGPGGMTYNNAPGNNTGDYTDMTGSTLLGGFSFDPSTVADGDTQTFMSSALDDFLNNNAGTDELATLVILGDQGGFNVWASRENTLYAGPVLNYDSVTPPPPLTPVPLPASALLLGSVLAGLFGLRKFGRRFGRRIPI